MAFLMNNSVFQSNYKTIDMDSNNGIYCWYFIDKNLKSVFLIITEGAKNAYTF